MADLETAFNRASSIEFDGFRFDDPSFDMLVFDENSYLEHLRVQSAGLAYFGTLAKDAERSLADAERRYKIRYNEMYSECSDILFRCGRKQVRDVEAMIQSKYESELAQWNDRIAELQRHRDGIAVFYEAWKAKGFSLNAMTSMITSGLLTPRTTISEDEADEARRLRMSVRDAHSVLARGRHER